MKIKVHTKNKILAAKLPWDNADHVTTSIAACPCGSMRVKGLGIREKTHDTYVADAVCVDCGTAIGQIRTTVDTIFGIEEDERVLNGRCRVY